MKKKLKFYSLWFLLINLMVFILQISFEGFTEMFVLNSNALNGEYWRFVTAIFLHGGVTHLMYNLFALFFFGIALEKLIGSRKFLLVFFTSGIIANIISINFYSSSLGASGAIMGIIGSLTIIKPFMMVWAFGLILPMFLAAILWVIGDILGVFMPSNVGNIAHLSGIGVGFILGLILRNSVSKKIKKIRKVVVPDYYMAGWEKKYMK
jgi:membrane associated rhomboid family serine protease